MGRIRCRCRARRRARRSFRWPAGRRSDRRWNPSSGRARGRTLPAPGGAPCCHPGAGPPPARRPAPARPAWPGRHRLRCGRHGSARHRAGRSAGRCGPAGAGRPAWHSASPQYGWCGRGRAPRCRW
ncbi:hypothetical protein G6F22_021343 [Rhizopus arrhizus]|nr:hypothetical protein G6F22_021343 [Rhizopus arrhizus]